MTQDQISLATLSKSQLSFACRMERERLADMLVAMAEKDGREWLEGCDAFTLRFVAEMLRKDAL